MKLNIKHTKEIDWDYKDHNKYIRIYGEFAYGAKYGYILIELGKLLTKT